MSLDTNTILTLLAFLAVLSGGLLLVVGYQSGATATAALWAASNLYLAAGTVLLLEKSNIEVAFLCLGVTGALQWAAIVKFNRRPIPAIRLGAAAILWAVISYLPPIAGWDFGPRAAIYLSLNAAYLGHCIWELWQRTERLPARRPLLVLLALDLVSLTFAAIAVIPMETLGVQPTGNTFLPVYFVSMAFVVGTAVFLMALVKERAVAEQTAVASTDNLTGLSTRGALTAAAAPLMAHTLGDGAPVAAILFDLDKFKSVNDNFGHQTGDVVLQRFAEAALAGLRPHDLIGRIGGEEFLAVLPSVSEAAAVAIADRIRRAFAETAMWVDGKPVKATVSAGVAISLPGARLETLHDLIDRADRALYSAKKAGRNRIATDNGPPDDDAINVVRLA